jgi:tRNA-splicing ligase RtcB
MNLAGDYAKACHDIIHYRLAKALGIKPVMTIENHHNFAWKEVINGQEMIVHRKGATPAAKGQLGIIPANMMDPGYIVSGKGNSQAINSASHGAGRKLSRKRAKSSFTGSELKKVLKQKNITLIGGGTEEAPWAYKDLESVILSQNDLLNIEGKFYPQIVRMDKQ